MRKFPIFTIFATALSACSGSQGSNIEYASETILEAGQEIADVRVEKSPVAYSPESGIYGNSGHPWQWIKVTSGKPGPISFRVDWTKGPTPYSDIVVEEFGSPFDGKSSENAIATHVRNYESDDKAGWLTAFSREMEAGEPAYFRVRGDAFESAMRYTFTCLPGEAAAPEGYSPFDGPLYEEPEVQWRTVSPDSYLARFHFESLRNPEYAWFRINAASAGLCHFVLEYEKKPFQGPSIIVEEFPAPFGGYGSDGRLAVHETNYLWTYDGAPDRWNAYFTRQVVAGESIYFRVREDIRDIKVSWTVTLTFSVSMIEAPFEPGGTITPLSDTTNP
jgi:hypothetical protein